MFRLPSPSQFLGNSWSDGFWKIRQQNTTWNGIFGIYWNGLYWCVSVRSLRPLLSDFKASFVSHNIKSRETDTSLCLLWDLTEWMFGERGDCKLTSPAYRVTDTIITTATHADMCMMLRPKDLFWSLANNSGGWFEIHQMCLTSIPDTCIL